MQCFALMYPGDSTSSDEAKASLHAYKELHCSTKNENWSELSLEAKKLKRAQALSVNASNSATALKVLTSDAMNLSDIYWSLEDDFYSLIKIDYENAEDFSVTSDLFDDDQAMVTVTDDDDFAFDSESDESVDTLSTNLSNAPARTNMDRIGVSCQSEHHYSSLSADHQSTIVKVQTLSNSLVIPSGIDQKDIKIHMRPLMEKSIQSQEALQEWDRLNGLPASHSKTMVNTSRSRKQLLEGIILRKWDGSPLIPAVGWSGNHV